MQMYVKGTSRFSYFLLHKGIIKNVNTPETYENRFNNRFRIFDKCYFLKRLDYETYLNVMKDLHTESEVPIKSLILIFFLNLDNLLYLNIFIFQILG